MSNQLQQAENTRVPDTAPEISELSDNDTSGSYLFGLAKGGFWDTPIAGSEGKTDSVIQIISFTTLTTVINPFTAGIGTYLIGKLLDKMDLNITFGNFFDPFGFFGSSWFRTTRYWYYYSQYSSENKDYMPDIIRTYSASAVASNQSVGDYIVKSIRQGRGVNLKKYYQYSTLRFGNRYWNWTLKQTKKFQSPFDTELLKKFLDNKYRNYHIINQNNTFEVNQEYYYYWVQQNYGLDQFNRNYNGIEYDVIEPRQVDNGYVIAESESGSELIVPYIPTEKSLGLTIWVGDNYLDLIDGSGTMRVEELELSKIPSNYPTTLNKVTYVDKQVIWKNPYDITEETDETKAQDEADLYSEYSLLGEIIIYKYATYIGESEDKTKKLFNISFAAYLRRMVQEDFIYLTEDGLTNEPIMTTIYKPIEEEPNNVLHNGNSNVIKFYPHMPIREWNRGKHTGTWTVPNWSKAGKEVSYVKQINTITEQNSNPDANELNGSVDRQNKQYQKKLNSKRRTERYRPNGILSKPQTREVGDTMRSLQRKLTRSVFTRRKIQYKTLTRPAKTLSTSAMKRHYHQMSELLAQDMDMLSLQFASEQGDKEIFERLVMPAVNFSSPVAEVHEYLYHFFKQLYNIHGRTKGYSDWKYAVENANSLNELPFTELSWKNQSGFDWGGLGFLFIHKFKMKGTIRKIKRTRRVYEVKRGRPIRIGSINDLKQVIEPLRELCDDKYYTTKAGVQHCIGGGYRGGSGTFEHNPRGAAFNEFDYTFFAKSAGNGMISVIAVAGLSFYTKMSEYHCWCRAWKDLDLGYARNRSKYINKNPNANHSLEFTRRASKKHYHINVIQHFGIIPLEYNSIRRMGGVNLERFANRAIVQYGFIFNEVKGKRKGLKPFIKVAGIVLTIVAIVLSVIFPPAGVAAWSATAFVYAIAVAVAVQLAIKFVVLPLIKMLGFKGIILLIIMIIIAIVASMYGGAGAGTQNVLPYASEVGKQTATEVAKELVKETISQSLMQAIKQGINAAVTQFFEQSALQLGSQAIQVAGQAYSELAQEEIQNIMAMMAQDQEDFNKAYSELQEKQEQIQSQIDVQEVLKNLRTRFKLYDPDMFIDFNSNPDEFSASYSYLENFIDMKLNIDPETFDPVTSLDFSFKKS